MRILIRINIELRVRASIDEPLTLGYSPSEDRPVRPRQPKAAEMPEDSDAA